MVLTREKKEESLKRLKNLFADSSASIAADYSGLSGVQLTNLRKVLKSKDIKLMVTKNSLVKKALEDCKLNIDETILDAPVFFAFGADEVETAKELYNFAKENESLNILGGIITGEQADGAKIKILAMLPGRDELQAKLVGILTAPTQGLVNVLTGNIRGLVTVLKQYQQKIS